MDEKRRTASKQVANDMCRHKHHVYRSRAFTLPAILIEFSRTLSEWRGLKGNFLELQTEANSDKRARVFDIMLKIGRLFTFWKTNIVIKMSRFERECLICITSIYRHLVYNFHYMIVTIQPSSLFQ